MAKAAERRNELIALGIPNGIPRGPFDGPSVRYNGDASINSAGKHGGID